MKKFRKLIPTFILMLLSMLMLGTSTFAWFSMNNQVSATGMEMKAKANGALIIDKTAMTQDDNGVAVAFTTTNVQSIKPSTYSGGWKVLKNNATIDMHTGSPFTTEVEAIGTGKEADYFVDYVCYMAASDTLAAQKITANISLSGVSQSIDGAVSIAFYFVDSTDSKGIYSRNGSLSADGRKALTSLVPTGIINVRDNKEGGLVGAGVADSSITLPITKGVYDEEKAVGVMVIMRLFIDGALIKDQPAYVPASGVCQSGVTYYDPDLFEEVEDPTADDFGDYWLKEGDSFKKDTHFHDDADHKYYTFAGTAVTGLSPATQLQGLFYLDKDGKVQQVTQSSLYNTTDWAKTKFKDETVQFYNDGACAAANKVTVTAGSDVSSYLVMSDAIAYVNSENIPTLGIQVGVKFYAEDVSTK